MRHDWVLTKLTPNVRINPFSKMEDGQFVPVTEMLRPIVTLSVFLLVFGSQVLAHEGPVKDSYAEAKPVLWEKVDIAQRDLYLGPGGADMKPDTTEITLIKEETGGSSKKFRIKDAAGRVWIAKLGNEAQSETAAVRLLWGLGYKTEINYLVPKLSIPTQGDYKNVRLEARPENTTREGRWSWKDNPFNNTDELRGLVIMMAFLNNWDIKKESNNVILKVTTGDRTELQYAISDLGATFGRTGYVNIPIFWRIGRHKNRPDEYKKSKFIDGVEDGRVEFSYAGRMPDLYDEITVGQTRFITELLVQLSEKQIRDAFRAANYSPKHIETLTGAVQRRIGELKKINGLGQAE